MHFVYKTDNLIRSIRDSHGNSSVQRDFIFLILFELHSFSVFKMHHSKPHHQFSTLSDFICYFSCIYWFFWAIRPWNWKKHYKWTLKRLKVGMVSSFHPHSMCKKVERLTTKTGCTSCTKGQSHLKYQGFTRELVCYKGISFSWTYLNSIVFLCSKCTIQRHIINFQPFLTSFVIFHAFTDFLSYKTLKLKKPLQMNSEKVESLHGVIISPT